MKYVVVVILTMSLLISCQNEPVYPSYQSDEPPTLAEGIVFDDFQVKSIPDQMYKKYKIDASYYSKYTTIWGIPICGSDEIEDVYLQNAAELVGHMLSDASLNMEHADLIRSTLFQKMVRIVLYPNNEIGTKQLPEYKSFADADAYGATENIPLMGVSVTNVSECYNGNDGFGRNKQGNSLVHEMMHTIHLFTAEKIHKGFNAELRKTYLNSKSAGIWNPSFYIIDTNEKEFLAEGAEIWFNWVPYVIEGNDNSYLSVRQEDLKEIDPDLFNLLALFFNKDEDVMDQINFCAPKVLLNYQIPLSIVAYPDCFTGSVKLFGDGVLLENNVTSCGYTDTYLAFPDPSISYKSYANYSFEITIKFSDTNREDAVFIKTFTKNELLNMNGFPTVEIAVNF